jgi:hypothetical protein
MRASCAARWATCALALSIATSICIPALADRDKRSLSTCATFDQVDGGEGKVTFTIHSTCSIPIDCALSWRVVCAPQSKKRRATHPGVARFALRSAGSHRTEASVAMCGDDAWEIDSVRWSCQPNND